VAETAELIPIRLLGTPHCEALHAAFFPAKGFALLAALLLAPNHCLPRTVAASLLWEDVEQKRALGNLRQLILRLQKLIGSEGSLVIVDGNDLRAGDLAHSSDLGRFLAHIRSSDPDRRANTLLLFGGDLLDGIDAGQDHFYLWLLSERRRLKDIFFSVFVQHLEELTRFGRGRADDIATLTECAIRVEPDREETYRASMVAYIRTGNTGASERIFQRLQHRLDMEGRGPEPATVAARRMMQSIASAPEAIQGDVAERRRPPAPRPRIAFQKPVNIHGLPATAVMQAFVGDVANNLVRYRTFVVLSPHSTFSVRGDGSDPRDATLRTDYRVVSTVFDDARMSVALIEEASGELIWSIELALVEQQIHSAFRILTKQVAAALAREVERLQIDTDRNHDAGAYLHLLEGQQLLSRKCDLPLLRRARSIFRKAVDLDHGMAIARARVAQTLQLEWLMLGGGDPHLLHRAKAEADASVNIDPALGTGHWMSAVIALYQRDFDTSAEKFLEAEALAPNSADLLLQHADALAHFGDREAAWEKFLRATDLNPFAPDIYWWAGASIAFDRQDYAGAIGLCAKMEDDEAALRVLTASHALNGDIEQARICAGRLQENYPGMSAREITALSPDRDPAANENFYNALRIAGVK
jgi:DNA-binding SARP family transcriptional activator/Tfp pilus assembly protein PilF